MTLYRERGGVYVPQTVRVDSSFPERASSGVSLERTGDGGSAMELWPRLLEKAFAVFEGGYDRRFDYSLLGRVLNELLAEEDEEVRHQKIDASKLPPFDEVEQYFGPAGLIVSPERDGWFIIGAMLSADGTELASRPQE